jgi:hypothetical protein
VKSSSLAGAGLSTLWGLLLILAGAAISRGEEASSSANPLEKQPPTEQAAVEGPSREVQRSLLQKMKSRKPHIRVAAARAVADYPTAEAARFLTQHGLASGFDDVRHASYETLVELNGAAPVADYLLAAVAKDVKRSTPRETTVAMLGIMLAAKDQQIERRSLELFDEIAARAEAGVLMALTLVDELGAQGTETAVSTLGKISKRRVFNERFAVRRAVVQSLVRISLPEAIDALVTILQTATGEVRGDIVRHLTSVSGRTLGLDPPAWAKWWQERQGKPPKPDGRTYPLADALSTKANYYGLPIYAARMVFVLDTSASMAGGRIAAAKRELSLAIANLPVEASFNVLAFDIVVSPWSDQLLPATPENKTAAIAWVMLRGLGPQTASYNALQAAFAFDTESIYFLTDGQPAGGLIDNPIAIVEVLSRLNQTRRLTINAIGIAVGPAGPANPFDLFLASLAARNYGEYRRVDQ